MPGRRTRTAWREATPLDRVLRSPAFRRFFGARAVSQRGRLVQRRRYRHPCLTDHRLGMKVGGAVACEIAPVLLLRFVSARPPAGCSADGSWSPPICAGLHCRLPRGFHSQLWTVYVAAFGLGPLWRLTPDRAPVAVL
jgi:hypothetical protein